MSTEASFKTIRGAGVPLCAIETADPAATVKGIVRMLGKADKKLPVLLWDIVAGLSGVNDLGKAAAKAFGEKPDEIRDPVEVLKLMGDKAPDDGVLFFSNAHRYIGVDSVAQAVWNLRDALKGIHGTLVLLCPAMTLPDELKHDVVVISEPLPTGDKLVEIIDSCVKDAEIDQATVPADRRPIMADILCGLSAFAAEQVVAMSMSKKGIDEDRLWERKRRMIEQTPGLQVWRGKESFDDIGGMANLKGFLTKVLTSGKTPVRALLYLDEIEKSLAGAGGDTSGTSQDQLGVLLTEMQDKDIPGIILVGPPGTGKSTIAKAAGSVASAPVIACDLGAMKGSLVGQSEQQIRSAMKVFQAISNGKGLAIATCNKLVALPPELKRRFSLACFYLDLPTAAERAVIWKVWLDRYSLQAQAGDNGVPEMDSLCEGWTGSEVKACCDIAYRTSSTLKEAAKFVVPVCKSAADQIAQLRTIAEGTFISATESGMYQMPSKKANRRMDII